MTTERKFIRFEDWQAQAKADIGPPARTQFERGVACGERLIGTPNSIESEAEEGDDWKSQEFCDGIDSVAFECNECGWWCEAGEATAGHDGSEDVCQDCAPGDD